MNMALHNYNGKIIVNDMYRMSSCVVICTLFQIFNPHLVKSVLLGIVHEHNIFFILNGNGLAIEWGVVPHSVIALRVSINLSRVALCTFCIMHHL